MHMIQKTFPTYEYDHTEDSETQFRLLPEDAVYDTSFVDRQYRRDTYWDKDPNDQGILDNKDNHNKPTDQVESNHFVTHSHVSDAVPCALTDLWTVNPQLLDTTQLRGFSHRP